MFIMNKNKGFTLIELLVVVAVIAALASIVMVAVSDARNKNADTAVKQALSSIPTQSELYAHANGFKYYVNSSNYLCHPTATGSVYPIVLNAAKNVGLTGIVFNDQSVPLGSIETSVNTATCNSLANTWAVEVPLRNKNVGGAGKSNMFCVDSTGFIGNRMDSMGAGNTACASQ
jgi:prepilin-type N-terminal cleavage/methylation domain-containing protein